MERIYICQSKHEPISVIIPISIDPAIEISFMAHAFIVLLQSGRSGSYFASNEKKYIWTVGQRKEAYATELRMMTEAGIISSTTNSFGKASYILTKDVLGIKQIAYTSEIEAYFTRLANHYPKLLKVVR